MDSLENVDKMFQCVIKPCKGDVLTDKCGTPAFMASDAKHCWMA